MEGGRQDGDFPSGSWDASLNRYQQWEMLSDVLPPQLLQTVAPPLASLFFRMETSKVACIKFASTGQRYALSGTLTFQPEEKHGEIPSLDAHRPLFDELSLRFTYYCRFDLAIFKDSSSSSLAFCCPPLDRLSLQRLARRRNRLQVRISRKYFILARTTPRESTLVYGLADLELCSAVAPTKLHILTVTGFLDDGILRTCFPRHIIGLPRSFRSENYRSATSPDGALPNQHRDSYLVFGSWLRA